MADTTDSKIQGEGDYEAARRYIDKTEKFAHSNKVAPAGANAKPATSQEQADLESAEQAGLEHSKAPGK